jgi:hypothetical protein
MYMYTFFQHFHPSFPFPSTSPVPLVPLLHPGQDIGSCLLPRPTWTMILFYWNVRYLPLCPFFFFWDGNLQTFLPGLSCIMILPISAFQWQGYRHESLTPSLIYSFTYVILIIWWELWWWQRGLLKINRGKQSYLLFNSRVYIYSVNRLICYGYCNKMPQNEWPWKKELIQASLFALLLAICSLCLHIVFCLYVYIQILLLLENMNSGLETISKWLHFNLISGL